MGTKMRRSVAALPGNASSGCGAGVAEVVGVTARSFVCACGRGSRRGAAQLLSGTWAVSSRIGCATSIKDRTGKREASFIIIWVGASCFHDVTPRVNGTLWPRSYFAAVRVLLLFARLMCVLTDDVRV